VADTALTIANRALQKLGAAPITSFDPTVDTSERAATMCTLYEPILRAALQQARWKFAQIDALLLGWTCVPVINFNCAYVLPGDLLQIEETNLDEQEPWQLQSFYCGTANVYTDILVTDSCSPIGISYTAYVTNPRLWSPLFTEGLVTELAYQASFTITSSQSRAQALENEREVAWRKAKARDGQSQKRLKRLLSNELLVARFGGSGRWPMRNENF
jgi:hypothetical protein